MLNAGEIVAALETSILGIDEIPLPERGF